MGTAVVGYQTRRRKRVRPEDGGIQWHREIHAFECLGCGEFICLGKRSDYDNPERIEELKELLIIEHTECWEFDDPQMAANARRYRKEKKRRENLAARRVSWRGR